MENNHFVLIPRFYAFSSCVVPILSACTICLNSSIDHNAEYFSSSQRFIISIHFNFCFLYSFTLIPYFTNFPTIIQSTLLVMTNWGFTTKIYFLTLWNINYSNKVLKWPFISKIIGNMWIYPHRTNDFTQGLLLDLESVPLRCPLNKLSLLCKPLAVR